MSPYELYDELTKFLNAESVRAAVEQQVVLCFKMEKLYKLHLSDEAWHFLFERRQLVEDLKLKVKVPELRGHSNDALRAIVQRELKKTVTEFVEEQTDKVVKETVYRLVEISMPN